MAKMPRQICQTSERPAAAREPLKSRATAITPSEVAGAVAQRHEQDAMGQALRVARIADRLVHGRDIRVAGEVLHQGAVGRVEADEPADAILVAQHAGFRPCANSRNGFSSMNTVKSRP